MLDKLIKVNKNQAYLIYDDGTMIGLYSDKDVNDIIMTIVVPQFYDGNFNSYCRSLEDTMSLDINEVNNE